MKIKLLNIFQIIKIDRNDYYILKHEVLRRMKMKNDFK